MLSFSYAGGSLRPIITCPVGRNPLKATFRPASDGSWMLCSGDEREASRSSLTAWFNTLLHKEILLKWRAWRGKMQLLSCWQYSENTNSNPYCLWFRRVSSSHWWLNGCTKALICFCDSDAPVKIRACTLISGALPAQKGPCPNVSSVQYPED